MRFPEQAGRRRTVLLKVSKLGDLPGRPACPFGDAPALVFDRPLGEFSLPVHDAGIGRDGLRFEDEGNILAAVGGGEQAYGGGNLDHGELLFKGFQVLSVRPAQCGNAASGAG